MHAQTNQTTLVQRLTWGRGGKRGHGLPEGKIPSTNCVVAQVWHAQAPLIKEHPDLACGGRRPRVALQKGAGEGGVDVGLQKRPEVVEDACVVRLAWGCVAGVEHWCRSGRAAANDAPWGTMLRPLAPWHSHAKSIGQPAAVRIVKDSRRVHGGSHTHAERRGCKVNRGRQVGGKRET